MTRWKRVFWTLAAGMALTSAGCGSETLYGVPPPGGDSNTDVEAEAVDDAEDVVEDEMMAGAYGPPPDM